MSELKWQDAVDFSHNFATAKPDILKTEQEHILGLCNVLKKTGSDRDNLLFALEKLHDLANHFNVKGTFFSEEEHHYWALVNAEEAIKKARGES